MQTVMILSKDEFLIRVKKHTDERYALDFSKDRFKTFKTKEYANRRDLLDVLEMEFELEELVGI